MSSGSKKRRAAPPELADWQARAIALVARSALAKEAVFRGGAALAAAYLHHRVSDDVDFFFMRPLDPAELAPIVRGFTGRGVTVDQRTLGVVRTLVLVREGKPFGKIDFAYYPYDPIERRLRYEGLRVESLVDMTVNKVQALLTRFQPRDFVDLWFLLREGPERDLLRVLDLVRAKFDVGADRLSLAERLLMAREIMELPRMIRPVTTRQLVTFFDTQARALVKKR